METVMNYEKIYDNIIIKAKQRGLKKRDLDYYTEKHHIVPRCLGGLNNKENLVLLTGREHYLCHWLLWKANKENKSLFYAYFSMIYIKHDLHNRNFKITSKQFHDIKSKNSNIMKNRIVSDETKKRISESRMGIVFSDDHKINIKNAAVERVPWNKNKNAIEYAKINLGMKRYQVLAAFNDDNNFEFEVIKCH